VGRSPQPRVEGLTGVVSAPSRRESRDASRDGAGRTTQSLGSPHLHAASRFEEEPCARNTLMSMLDVAGKYERQVRLSNTG